MTISIWTTSFVFTLAAFVGVWAVHVRMRDAGVIDYYWGPGFALSGWLCFAIYGTGHTAIYVLLAAVTLWSVRLAWHLVARHRRAQSEDARYAVMREAGGEAFWWKSLFSIFFLQAIIHWLVSAPLIVSILAEPTTNVSGFFWLGMILFMIGFAIEAIADAQLAEFKRGVPEGGLFRSGLWGLSRHPNYVGEMILWIGIGISAFSLSGSLLAVAGPLFLIIVMRGISVPLTDQHMRRSRRNYEDYEISVPTVLPVLQRKSNRAATP